MKIDPPPMGFQIPNLNIRHPFWDIVPKFRLKHINFRKSFGILIDIKNVDPVCTGGVISAVQKLIVQIAFCDQSSISKHLFTVYYDHTLNVWLKNHSNTWYFIKKHALQLIDLMMRHNMLILSGDSYYFSYYLLQQIMNSYCRKYII